MERSVRFTASLLLALLLGVTTSARAQDDQGESDSVVIDGTPHPPDQIMKLIDQSILMYEVGWMSDSVCAEWEKKTEYPVLDGYWSIVTDSINGDLTLIHEEFSDTIATIVDLGESAFQAMEYSKAMEYYRRALALDSNLSELHVLVGDVFYVNGQYDSAAVYFRSAVELNPVHYRAHWFLADALWALGDEDGCVRELTMAHILNVNHQVLLEKLKTVRDEIGRPWLEWSFRPVCEIFRDAVDSHLVHIQTPTKWLGYAMVKALWEFEPGYAEKMGESDASKLIYSNTQARELLMGALLSHRIDSSFELSTVTSILENGDAYALMMYEWVAPRVPSLLLLLPIDKRESFVEFVEKYH